MRALPALLLLLAMLAVTAGAAPAQPQAPPAPEALALPQDPPAPAAPAHPQGPAGQEAPAASPAPPMGEAPAADLEDPYRRRMSAGHSVQPPRQRPWISAWAAGRGKAALALAGAALLLWGALTRTDREPPARRRTRDGLLLALAAAAAWGWWNFGAFHHPDFGHPSDTYPRVVGAKYLPELGTSRLYLCTAVADVEAGLRAQVERRYPRAPGSGDVREAAQAMARPETCKRHFSDARWQAFQADVAWFRDRSPVRRWQETQAAAIDPATPPWTAFASRLANLVPISDAGIFALRLLDPLLLAAMWGAVAAAFGWRAACVAVIFWGTQHPAQYAVTGGSFGRQAWLAAGVIAICALRRGRPALAGGLLALAIGLRLHPVFVLAALGVQALASRLALRRGGLSLEHRRVFAGAGVVAALLLAASFAGGGVAGWTDAFAKSEAYRSANAAQVLGLARIVSGAVAGTSAAALAPWLLAALLAGYLALFCRVAVREPAWVVAVLGFGWITLAGNLPGSESAGLLAFGLLWPRRPAIGVALCLLSFAGWWIVGAAPAWDPNYTAVSGASVAFIVFATSLLLTPAPPREPAEPSAA